MDAFEVRLTPQRLKNTRMVTQNREPVRLMMAPFSSKSVITFEDIPVSKTARRFLIIENPLEDSLGVTLSCKNTQKPIKNLQFEWLENTVPSLGEATVEITWTPSEAVACKETFLVTDQRGFKKELHIIFKSIGAKTLARKPLPLRARNCGGLLTVSGASSNRMKTPSPPSKKRVTGQRLSPLNDPPYKAQKTVLDRKTTPKRMTSTTTVTVRDYHLQEDKENSPVFNGSDIFKNIQFTPAADKNRGSGLADYMASLPTPKLGEVHNNVAHSLNLLVSSKKIVWSPIFEEIREERSKPAVFEQLKTPEIIVTQHITEECIQTKTVLKDYINLELPDAADARRSLFEDEVGAPLNPNTSTETFIKDLTINDANKTRILTPPTANKTTILTPPTAINGDTLRVSHVFQVPLTIAKNVEQIVTTPLQKKSSESMRNLSSKKTRETEYLKLNQGSMPNLHEIESINSIENNRYYSQVAAANQMNPPPPPPKQTTIASSASSLLQNQQYDSDFLLFKENGIRAQSSCSNLHELPDNTGLIKTNSERILQSTVTGFNMTPAASRVKCPFMTLSPPKSVTQSAQRRTTVDQSSAKWSQAVRLAAKAKREEQLQQSSRNLHNVTDTNTLMKMACQVPIKQEKRRVFYDADMHVQAAINPDPFAATTTHDPFLSATMYLDEKATDKYEKQFKNWLNALVTVPIDMDSDQGTTHGLDVGKIFNEVRHNKKETLAQTKESVSCKYFTRYRMPLLRRAAVELYTSEAIVLPLSKLDVLIEKRQIGMREDRNLHLDLVLQRSILELLLCFNTLWLRIGLEVVFGEEIPLSSNADIYGLTSFVLNRLFRDKYLEQKYNRNYALTAKYAEQIKKFALRKLLHLIVFLDAAKEQRIIKHNPCLFTRASQYKETKEILIKVASQLIANIGDITKYMKRLGITLVHKQTYLDEFDYAFTNLAVDLRDGIRLTKVMEIILLRDDLTKALRYPAVSRLQKIHNVDVGLKALQDAEYQIRGEITPKDIVDGHREKTLSLLWQLIYKFRAPKFNAAASIVQRWWRVRLLQREVDYRVVRRRQARMHDAAVTIQRHVRGYLCRKMVPAYVRERTIATVVVQTYFRAFVARKKYLQLREAAIEIQSWWRRNKDMHAQRKRFVELRGAAMIVQRRVRANKARREAMQSYEALRRATVVVQQRFRANVQRKKDMMRYEALKRVTVMVQTRYRANRLMKVERQRFLEMKRAALVIQRRFRDYCLMKRIKMDFVKVQYSVTVIQRYYRGYKAMQRQRGEFEALKKAAIVVQRRFRANVAMRVEREEFVTLKRTVQFVEEKYRAKMLAKEARMRYLRVKWATVSVQRQFRAQLEMKRVRKEYEETREKIIKVQRYFRGYQAMKKEVDEFERMKWAVKVVQVRFRAKQQMIIHRKEYVKIREGIVKIQRWVRANQKRDVCRAQYLKDRHLVVEVQRKWRAKLLGRETRKGFEEMKKATIVIQRRFRANQKMNSQRTEYQRMCSAVICLQRKWRARQTGIRVKQEYAQKKELIVGVQRRWRSKMVMRKQREEFVTLRKATIALQCRWRARIAMRVAVAEYQQLRRFTITVQTQWRAILVMREERQRFLEKRRSAIEIQRHVRGFLVRQEMRRQKWAAETLQMYYRAHVERKRCEEEYKRLKWATLTVQREWRRRCVMRRDMAEYQVKRELIIAVQRRFRAMREMRREREQFLVMKVAVIVLQQRLRAVLMGRQVRTEMEQKRRVVIRIQSLCRGVLARTAYKKLWYEKMSPEAIELRKRNVAALKIQSQWRGYRARRKYQSKAIKAVAQKIKQSRKVKQQDRVTVKVFLGASMHRLKLGLNVSDATKIFRSLDFYSRVVPHVLVANCVQVARYCYTMLSQATRSEPHKYLIELCCRVALNLARYEGTRKQIFLYEYLETIGQMLLRWSDKECPIFNTLCTLIFVFIQTPSHKRIIHNYMTMRDGVFILKETKKAVIRKERMLTNKQKLGVYRTQSTETDLERLPTLECDYGMELPTHLYVFKSRVFGFNTILSELDIELH